MKKERGSNTIEYSLLVAFASLVGATMLAVLAVALQN